MVQTIQASKAAPMAAPLPVSLLVVGIAAVAAASIGSAATIIPREALPTKSGYLPIPVANASLYYAYGLQLPEGPVSIKQRNEQP